MSYGFEYLQDTAAIDECARKIVQAIGREERLWAGRCLWRAGRSTSRVWSEAPGDTQTSRIVEGAEGRWGRGRADVREDSTGLPRARLSLKTSAARLLNPVGPVADAVPLLAADDSGSRLQFDGEKRGR